ncbi:hypothetical protein KC19_5G056600 [Ceratodon purpureus]|uniref:Myb-like domain-containing protein n=1 Tax=Ceratodon purpureus TaxID=3225 RepID=A0A8T0I0E3_CERPU|nr:hypothetical protein KC19_5G056600 [Ceratodon purpureus]
MAGSRSLSVPSATARLPCCRGGLRRFELVLQVRVVLRSPKTMAMTWSTLFRALLPVQVIREIVHKVFGQPPQDTEMVEGSDVGDNQDAALSIRESSESGEIQAHRRSTDNIDAQDKSKLHLLTDGEASEEGRGSLKEMVAKTFRQPPQDSEMVEGNGDDHDASLDCSIRESSVIGETEPHRRSTPSTEGFDKSNLHLDTNGEALEEDHDIGKVTDVEIFQQRPQDSAKVEGSGIAYYHNAAPVHFVPESSERAEHEAHHSRTFDVEQVGRSKPYPESEAEAQRDIHGILTTIRDGQPVIDQHPAEHPLSWKRPRGGKKRGSPTVGLEKKKRQRCTNWTDHETEQLVILRLERNLVKKKSKGPLWEAVSKQISGRTPKQCQNRWDTVSKSYKRIMDSHNKQFSQITVEDYQKMKAEKSMMSETRNPSIESEATVAEHELSGVRFHLNLFQWMMVLAVDLIFSLGIVAGGVFV